MSVAGGELDKVICWLTGPDGDSLECALAEGAEFRHFFAAPPALNPAPETVTCHCDVRIEETAEPQMREIRILDRPVDKLAKRRPRMKVLRRN